MFDTVIKNARIADGTGTPIYKADVGIIQDKIATVRHTLTEEAHKVISAGELVISPGFIDIHSHNDAQLLFDPDLKSCIHQGVTTVLMGQDGLSVAPIDDENLPLMRKKLSGLLGKFDGEWSWRSMGDYLDFVEKTNVSVNTAMCVPHSNVRAMVHGWEATPCTPDEIRKMAELTARCMDEGAIAFSTGLIYPPAMYAGKEEFIAILRVVAAKGGFLQVHLRSEGKWLLESIDEVASYCKATGCPLQLTHLKVFGKVNWGKSELVLEKIDALRSDGLDVMFDQYPYTAGSTMLDACIPPWHHSGGTIKMLSRLSSPEVRDDIRKAMADPESPWENSFAWDDIIIATASQSGNNVWMEGLSITQIAAKLEKDPVDTVADLLIEEEDAVTMIRIYGCEEDVKRIMRHPAMCGCTDGIIGGKPHPRVYSAFPRILARYVREQKILSIEGAIRRMTCNPARRMGLFDRGIIRPGMKADLVLFNSDSICDLGAYESPHQYPSGIEYVFVNGKIALEKGIYKNIRAGEVLKRRCEKACKKRSVFLK